MWQSLPCKEKNNVKAEAWLQMNNLSVCGAIIADHKTSLHPPPSNCCSGRFTAHLTSTTTHSLFPFLSPIILTGSGPFHRPCDYKILKCPTSLSLEYQDFPQQFSTVFKGLQIFLTNDSKRNTKIQSTSADIIELWHDGYVLRNHATNNWRSTFFFFFYWILFSV